MIPNTDPLNLTVVKINALFNEIDLGPATGFFYSASVNGVRQLFLVTNWHVFAGRNALNPVEPVAKTTGAIPNRLRLHALSDKGAKGETQELGVFHHEIFIGLYNADGEAEWYQHSRKNEIDVAVINLGTYFDKYAVRPVDEIANQYDMSIEIGDDVFILGYPLGFEHFLKMPIWKKGCIASEPHAEVEGSNSTVVIDATTRAGMSGSPVIVRARTHYVSNAGKVVEHPNASRLLGVYSSRPQVSVPQNAIEESDRRPELGYVFKSGLIEQIIMGGIRGPRHGELP